MKKQLLRVKQIADQTFLRAEKTNVLTEDLVASEKRVEAIKLSCQLTHKKIIASHVDFASETSLEKRMRKIPQILLGASMLESSNSFSTMSVLGETLKECSGVQTKLGAELLEYCNEVEKLVLKPLAGVLENEIHTISKLRKQLGKLVLDMDSARTRYQTAERQASCNATALREELEDASQKVEQCRDSLAAEMFGLMGREPELAQLLLHFHRLQASYHRSCLALLEASLDPLEGLLRDHPQQRVWGRPLEEHLRVSGREIALPIHACVTLLSQHALSEEGLLRIGGSNAKLKKIKSAFDAGLNIDVAEFIRDPHTVSGALKSYLRELPEPLMTSFLYNEWMDAARNEDVESRLKALWQVLHKLPEANYNNFRCVIRFLAKVYENVERNKMSAQNLAIVMSPNLIWCPEDHGMNMSVASLHTSLVDTLIVYAEWFFPSGGVKEKEDNSDKKPPDVRKRPSAPPPGCPPGEERGPERPPRCPPAEAVKPARPQLPAKPKFPIQSENTNL